MPEIEIAGDGGDVARVHAIMLFPDSEPLRRRHIEIEQLLAQISNKPEDTIFGVSVKTLRLLLESPAHSDQKTALKARTKSGIIAGDLLSVLYVMDRYKLEPSMNRAIWAVRRFAETGAKFGDGTKLPLGERQIRKHWNTFSPVAHLWGAMSLNRAYPFTSDGTVFSTPEHFARFLGVAIELFRFGTTFVPKGTHLGKPILDRDSAFALPAHIDALALDSDEHPELLRQLLADYKAPMPYG